MIPNKPDSNKDDKNKSPKRPKFNMLWIYAGLLGIMLFFSYSNFNNLEEIRADRFEQLVVDNVVERIVIVNEKKAEIFLSPERARELDKQGRGPHLAYKIGNAFAFEKFYDDIYAQNNLDPSTKIRPSYEDRVDYFGMIISWVLPIAIIIAVWMFIMKRMTGGSGMGGPAGGIFNFGKSKASLYDAEKTKVNVTFNDVAGLEEAKEEVMEVVDFLKNPKKYTNLGGKIPKGVLLVGPPGTGKTLIAKAMAGEAKVPFFSLSGSDFVEMFVGVGASRVRDLFSQAREKSPCIVFIDEIDAIGRARGKNNFNSNDERENTLNQLLVEMDGFSSETAVIMVAATNRPDVLDSALLRPGRFDRQISVDRPDLVGRTQIFNVHLKNLKKLSDDVSAKRLGELTPGFVGADIMNVCNEAALMAARREKDKVEMIDFQDAIDRVIGGLEKKNKLISPEEKKIIAYHEAGHAICGWYLEHADPLLKVSIVPRGVAALGYAQYLPKEQYLQNTDQMLDRMCKTLAGRAAEEVVFGKISTGAQNDLDQVTKTAYAMVNIYGMTKNIGHVSYYEMLQDNQLVRPYSDQTARMIDEEVKTIIQAQYERAVELLKEKRNDMELLAQELLKKEVLIREDLEELIGPMPFHKKEKLEPNHSDQETTDSVDSETTHQNGTSSDIEEDTSEEIKPSAE